MNGARNPPLAPSTWIGMSRPVCLLVRVEGLADGLDRLVLAGEGHAEGGDDADGVLVHALDHFLRRHDQPVAFHRDLAQLDVPVAGELVPADLDRAGHQVGLVGGLAQPPSGVPAISTAGPSRRAWRPRSTRWSRCQACWRRRVSSTGWRACARSVPRARRSAGTRPCRSCSCRGCSAMISRTSGSAQVWQNVARFCRELPSSMSSSTTTWRACRGSCSCSCMRYLGMATDRSLEQNTSSSMFSRTVFFWCSMDIFPVFSSGRAALAAMRTAPILPPSSIVRPLTHAADSNTYGRALLSDRSSIAKEHSRLGQREIRMTSRGGECPAKSAADRCS